MIVVHAYNAASHSLGVALHSGSDIFWMVIYLQYIFAIQYIYSIRYTVQYIYSTVYSIHVQYYMLLFPIHPGRSHRQGRHDIHLLYIQYKQYIQ